MSEQVRDFYAKEIDFDNGPVKCVLKSDYDALQSRLDAAEREKSALRHALDVKEEFYQDALHSHIVLNAKVAKRDAVLRETADSLRCSKVFPALLESIDALLSSAEPVKAEFCCELSFKAAKQKEWDARLIERCKCDHNEYCEHCWPDDFKEGGKWYNGFEAQQSTPERTDGWISVSERLPDVAQEVIVDSEFDGVTAGFLDSYGEWYSPNSDYKLTRVVAWQPLPAAPSLLASHGRGEANG